MEDYYKRFKICVSGAAETSHCGESALTAAESLGAEVAGQNSVLITGATTGFPFRAAKGAKKAGGLVVGVSPAATEAEHIKKYNLPLDYHDLIFYTGAGYAGRNLLLTRLADAVIFGCGRMGTLNEFTIAFEDKKPIGILEGEWETDELFREIIEKSHRAQEMKGRIIYDSNPQKLVEKTIELVKKEKENNHN